MGFVLMDSCIQHLVCKGPILMASNLYLMNLIYTEDISVGFIVLVCKGPIYMGLWLKGPICMAFSL